MQETSVVPTVPPMLADDLPLHHVADNVEFLNTLPPEEAAELLLRLPPERAAEILDQPELYTAPEIIRVLPGERGAGLLTAMAADRAVDVLHLLEAPVQASLLARLDRCWKAIPLTEFLPYPLDFYPDGN